MLHGVKKDNKLLLYKLININSFVILSSQMMVSRFSSFVQHTKIFVAYGFD